MTNQPQFFLFFGIMVCAIILRLLSKKIQKSLKQNGAFTKDATKYLHTRKISKW